MKKEKTNQKRSVKITKPKVIAVTSIVLLLTALVCVIFWGKEGTHTIETTNTLKKIIKTENLNTVEYTYNAVATKKKGEKVHYYVAYEGIVKAGVEFDEIKMEVNEKSKIITITIPKVKITETIVNEDTLDFIFTKNKYDTKDVLEEAIELCKKDLAKRTKEEELLVVTAEQNAMSGIKAFFQPWIDTLDEEYEVKFVQEVNEHEK